MAIEVQSLKEINSYITIDCLSVLSDYLETKKLFLKINISFTVFQKYFIKIVYIVRQIVLGEYHFKRI